MFYDYSHGSKTVRISFVVFRLALPEVSEVPCPRISLIQKHKGGCRLFHGKPSKMPPPWQRSSRSIRWPTSQPPLNIDCSLIEQTEQQATLANAAAIHKRRTPCMHDRLRHLEKLHMNGNACYIMASIINLACQTNLKIY